MCEHCAAGLRRIKLKRQYVHRVGFTTIVCIDTLKPVCAS